MKKLLIGMTVVALLGLLVVPAMADLADTAKVNLEVVEVLKVEISSGAPLDLTIPYMNSGDQDSFTIRAVANTAYDILGKIEGNSAVKVGEYNSNIVNADQLAWGISSLSFNGEDWKDGALGYGPNVVGSLDNDSGGGTYAQEGPLALWENQPANEPADEFFTVYVGVCTWTWLRLGGPEEDYKGYVQAGTYDNAATITMTIQKHT